MAIEKIQLPDFGEVKSVIIVEMFISVGDEIEKDSSLMSLESDKAVMDLPSPFSGVIKEIHVKDEDEVTVGDLLISIEVSGEIRDSQDRTVNIRDSQDRTDSTPQQNAQDQTDTAPQQDSQDRTVNIGDSQDRTIKTETQINSHATPSVRSYARELDINLSDIEGTGPKGRILKSDVQNLVKRALKGGGTGSTVIPDEPLEDFSKYGEIEEVKLGRIKKISGPHLHKSWISIPHVTHFDEADITEIEDFRKQMNKESVNEGIKYSPLGFVIKAVVAALKEYPMVNSSLIPGGAGLILKKFYHIGIAVDTPQGLVVPVIKDADKKGIKEISIELQELSSKAREGKLAISDLQGASFTISSLGGIGGTAFTPIINQPQVAILGLSRSFKKPFWDGEYFIPRLTLPLSLSYDHRVIDGAEAARFCRSLGLYLEDLKRVLL
ncbi:MAG: 2-oxo acid dehydrogenase subunit E2 [Spirochaetaceae bacterium]|jgi:pyruvate dehydrogenase E2 component (dihydrolipoamide acetyltransferase)|nr:2-oxo acid dehydrogenase subunit E2 [Spirochaetaceae bacterium]